MEFNMKQFSKRLSIQKKRFKDQVSGVLIDRILSIPVVFLLIIAFCGSCTGETQWYKGNMHIHTFRSDGDDFPEVVVKWYKESGYDFIVLTDHNTLPEGEMWRKFPADHPVLLKYIKSCGKDCVGIRPDENEEDQVFVRLKPLDEYRHLYEVPGRFLVMSGAEIANSNIFHMVEYHMDTVLPVLQGSENDKLRVFRDVTAKFDAYRSVSGRNTYPVLAHPNYRWFITAEMILEVPEIRFFEVYNGHPAVHNEGDKYRASTDRIWDIVLSFRLINKNGNLMYGLAVDDAHSYQEKGGKGAGPGRGWVMVKSKDLTPESLLDALDKGDFYASTGVTINKIEFNGKTLKLEIKPQPKVDYLTEFIGTLNGFDTSSKPALDSLGNPIHNTTRIYSDRVGEVLKSSNDLKPAYTFSGNELYVRARITSTASQVDPITGRILEKQKAWVQPFSQCK